MWRCQARFVLVLLVLHFVYGQVDLKEAPPLDKDEKDVKGKAWKDFLLPRLRKLFQDGFIWRHFTNHPPIKPPQARDLLKRNSELINSMFGIPRLMKIAGKK